MKKKVDALSKKIDAISYCRESAWKKAVTLALNGGCSWGEYYRWCEKMYKTLTYRELRRYSEENNACKP